MTAGIEDRGSMKHHAHSFHILYSLSVSVRITTSLSSFRFEDWDLLNFQHFQPPKVYVNKTTTISLDLSVSDTLSSLSTEGRIVVISLSQPFR